MPAGSATQTKLQFINKDRPSDTPMNTNGGEQHGDDDPQQQTNIAQRQKRQRNDLE